MQLEEFLDRLEGVSQTGPNRWMARCPSHDDNVRSLSIKDAEDKILLNCHANCPTKSILEDLNLTWGDLWYDNTETWKQNGNRVSHKVDIEDEYLYCTEDGTLLYKVVRYPGKRFKHERRYVPYRLPELVRRLPESTVFVVEGEKDVHALEAQGQLATCNAGGAGAWQPEFDRYFEGANVIVWADKDEPGIKHAFQVAESLIEKAVSVLVVQSRVGKDAADHLDAGYGPLEYEIVRKVK